MNTNERLNVTFSALADPTRRAILSRLASGETSVLELAKPFRMTLPAVSKHLKVLHRAGLIVRVRRAQWRPCRLNAGPLRDVSDWVERYRRFWDQSFDRLGGPPRERQKQDRPRGRSRRKNDRYGRPVRRPEEPGGKG